MNLVEARLDQNLEGHRSAVYCLSTGLEENTFLSAGSDGLICQWNSNGQSTGQVLARTEEKIFCLHTNKDHQLIVAGCMNGDVFFIHKNDKSPPRRFRVHSHAVYKILELNQQLIMCAGDGVLSLWNFEDNKPPQLFKISNSRLRSLSYDPQQARLYVGDSHGDVFVLSVPDFGLVHKIENLHTKTVFSMLYNPHKEYLITGGLDAQLVISAKQFKELKRIKAHWFCINSICLLEPFALLATCSRDKSIRLWDAETFDLVKELSRPKFAAHLHSVNALLWLDKENVLVSGSDDATIKVWTLNIDYDS